MASQLLVFIFLIHALTVKCSSAVNDTTPNYPVTNSAKHRHRWVGPIGHRVITVDVNGSAHFRSVQAAVNAVPENNRMKVLIQINAGYYMYI